jgi:GNAT superfamily N-acetyltransferase
MRDTGPWGDAIVQITHGQRASYVAHLKRLDALGILQRFSRLLSDAELEGYATALNLDQHTLLAVVVEGEARATLELRPVLAGNTTDAATSTYQGALVVEAPWRRRGMGQALLGNALAKVRNSGGLHVVIDNLSCAKDLRGLAAKFSAEFNFDEQDCQAWFALAADCKSSPTQVSSLLPVR